MNNDERDNTDIVYRIRIQLGIIFAELILLALFNLWPVMKSDNDFQSSQSSDQSLVLEDIPITSQSSAPPAPPAPVVPVVVPNDQIIKEKLPQFNDIGNDKNAKIPKFNGMGGNGRAPIVGNPGRPPSVVKIVEPAVPEAAKKAHVKVEIIVNFLVGTNGAPEKVSIAKIKLYDKKTDKFKEVKTIDYGIIKVTLKAAAQWRFRPAEQNGKKVRANSKHIFTFGI